MPAKRKRDILDGFDPNKSDSDDENFDPASYSAPPARHAPKSKQSKTPRSKGRGGARPRKIHRSGYASLDLDDDEDDVTDESGPVLRMTSSDESDEDLPVNATGRRIRKAAVNHQSYKESSVDSESVVEDSDDELKTAKKPSRIVVLKTDMARGGRRAKPEIKNPPPPPTRRATRARTEETEEPLYELSNSGKHALPADSASKSPEATLGRSARATRGVKGIKKPPSPIKEATQESDPKMEAEEHVDDEDELAGDAEEEHPDHVEEVAEEDADVAPDAQGEQDVPEEAMEDAPVDDVADQAAEDGDDDDDDDDAPLTRRTRSARGAVPPPAADEEADAEPEENPGRRPGRKLRRRDKKSMQEPSSDFEPGEESAEENLSGSDVAGKGKKRADVAGDDSSTPTPARGRVSRSQGRGARKTQHDSGDEEVELDKDEMAEELEELRESSRSRPRRTRRRSPSIQYEERVSKTRRTKPVNYSIPAIDLAALEVEEDEEPTQTPARGRKGGKGAANQNWERNFNSTYGPFGGGGGAGSLLGGPWGTGATGGVDSDSSDDEMVQRSGIGGTVGMTPTSAVPPVGLFGATGQGHNADAAGGIGGATPNVGKVKNQKAYADADPLGVDLSVDFSKVGGLQGHIDQLKEMVQLPLLYPELFLKFHVTPPRGVLFHGPPGTGKTLLARALANSVGSGGRKISFYMRKGADALSKWVGEAEKQLRLLFEEARRTQPSIIFFDEIDGLAPVRSSKQEQIHASIVSTLLALMDGMDGRGQVIVIGATNRPDNIDPALRRPGRFDREFYFPLPDIDGRRSIIDIHTKDWGISDQFKNALAENTKGYGGADLRALCTEAALNSIQRTYPQIYSSKEKLVVDPDKITIHATDFMLSVKKMIPSSERSASSAATPIPRPIEPLLRNQYKGILEVLDNILPRPKKTTALEEAMYEPYHDADHGFGREAMHQEFERSRIFRPRLLLSGVPGMGQNYLAAAVLHYLEGVHVQNFDLATLLGDGRPLEQVIVSLFTEVRRHKPSVIYIPTVDAWWTSLGEAAITTFTTMLRNIPPADPVLLLATAETLPESISPDILRELFGFSKKNRAVIERPSRELRIEFFENNIVAHIRKTPAEFPNPVDRKKRVLDQLPVAPPPPPKTLTKEEIKAQRKADLHHLNLLKMRLQPIMDQINRKYRKFRHPVIPLTNVAYLFNESDPNFVRPDLAEGEVRPYEIATDKEGTQGIKEVATGKFFYNLETNTIEERLANGYYARPIDFYKDVNRLYLDAKNIGDRDRTLKANELRTNVEVDVHDIGVALGNQGIRFDEIYERQLKRFKEAQEKASKRKAFQPMLDLIQSDVLGDGDSDSQGPVGIGLPMPRDSRTTTARFLPIMSPRSNGRADTSDSHALTNGVSDPSRRDGEDIQMGGVDDGTQAMSASQRISMGPPLRFHHGAGPLGDSTRATAGTQLSQRSAVTSVPAGVSPLAMQNDASTTKTSDASTDRAAVSGDWSTQHTNGVHSNADETSQLLDTQLDTQPQSGSTGQSNSSGRDWAHSQADGIAQGLIQPRMGMFAGGAAPSVGGLISEENSPTSSQKPGQSSSVVATAASRKSTLENILNEDHTTTSNATTTTTTTTSSNNTGTSSQSRSSQQPVIHEGRLREFLDTLADRTSGCTIEQLEQINRELMDEIWRTRTEWNRMAVLSTLLSVFNDTISDIELVQGTLLSASAAKEKEAEDSDGEEDEGEGGSSQVMDTSIGVEEEAFFHLR